MLVVGFFADNMAELIRLNVI